VNEDEYIFASLPSPPTAHTVPLQPSKKVHISSHNPIHHGGLSLRVNYPGLITGRVDATGREWIELGARDIQATVVPRHVTSHVSHLSAWIDHSSTGNIILQHTHPPWNSGGYRGDECRFAKPQRRTL